MKRKYIKISVMTAAAVVLAAAVSAAGARHFLHKSAASVIYEKELEKNNKKLTADEEKQRINGPDPDRNPDAWKDVNFREDFSSQEWDGLKTYYLNSINQSNVSIIYFHGGDFTDSVSKKEWEFLDRVANETDAEIIIPDYRLAPQGSYSEAVEDIGKLCVRYMDELDFKRYFFMGEGSGCSLMLSVSDDLVENNERTAEVMFMYSPWIDLSLEDPKTDEYEAVDPYHSKEALIVDAETFAGDRNPEDPCFDHLNKEPNLPKTYIYCGKKDLFYPGAEAFIRKLDDAGIEVHADIRDAMNYGYAEIKIKEAETVIENIENEIGEP